MKNQITPTATTNGYHNQIYANDLYISAIVHHRKKKKCTTEFFFGGWGCNSLLELDCE